MNMLNTLAQELRFREAVSKAEWDAERKADRERIEATTNRFWNENQLGLRRAATIDYKRWLDGYVEAGGHLTHSYDYNMPTDFYIATRNITAYPLYGSASIHVIVPSHLTLNVEHGIGHCTYYLMKDFNLVGSWVPVYQNVP